MESILWVVCVSVPSPFDCACVDCLTHSTRLDSADSSRRCDIDRTDQTQTGETTERHDTHTTTHQHTHHSTLFTHIPAIAMSSVVGSAGAPGYFVDHKRGEVNELKLLLNNPKLLREVDKKREVIKKVRGRERGGMDGSMEHTTCRFEWRPRQISDHRFSSDTHMHTHSMLLCYTHR